MNAVPTPLPRAFYDRDPAIVARELLGMILIRRHHGRLLAGRIVETEAYYGTDDPASRAFSGKPTPLNAPMWGEPGTILVYMVHGNWLFNIVTLPKGVSGAVLIRAVEPLTGLAAMLKARRRRNPAIHRLRELASGPGKLTQALGISNRVNWKNVLGSGEVWVSREALSPDRELPAGLRGVKGGHGQSAPAIATSHRIGVTRDLPRHLRFYYRDDPFVSK